MTSETSRDAPVDTGGGLRVWTRWWAWLLAAIVLAWAASPFLLRLPRLGSGQANDYFPTIGLVADGSGWSTDLGDWISVRSNEHRVFVSTVIYRVNVALSQGDNRGLAVWSLLMMLVTSAALISLFPPDLAKRPVPWALAVLVVAAFAITPVAAHNVALGFSGTMWLTANALSMVALALVSDPEGRRSFGRGARWRFASAIGLALLASWTYSTGLMSWGALLVLLLLQRQSWRRVATVLALGGGVVVLSLTSYGRPAGHPEPNTGDDPGLLVDYVWTYLGALHSTDPAAAYSLGVVGCLLALAVFGLLTPLLGRRERRLLVWPWLAVALFGLSNAVATGVGRSGMGVEQAMASRYGTLASFVWIGILLPPLLAMLDLPKLDSTARTRWAGWAVLAVLAVGVVSPSRVNGTRLLDRFVERASRHPVAHYALRHGILDEQVFSVALTPATSQLWDVRSTLEAIGHIPFDRRAVEPSGRVEEVGEMENVGYLDSAVGVPGGWVRLRGWSLHPTQPVEEIVFTDAERNIVGVGLYGTHRADVAEVIGEGAGFAGFMGYVKASPGRAPKGWVRFRGAPRFYPLVAIESIETQWERAVSAADSTLSLRMK